MKNTNSNSLRASDPSRLTPRLRMILMVVIIADVLDLMDSTITNIAAPSIVQSIGGGELLIKWLTAAYALAMGVLLVIGGRLGDRYGKRRLYLIGIIGFTLASAFCGFSVNPTMIIIGRLIQGGFGALLIPQGMSILMATFSREQFPRAVSVFGPIMSISSVFGPILAGFIIQANIGGLGWRPMFLINIILGLIGLVAAIKSEEKLDGIGTLLLGISMVGLIYGLNEGPVAGWTIIPVISLLAGILFLGAFAFRQIHASNPLIKPELFKNKGFTSGMLLGLAFFAAVSGLSYVISLFFQMVLHLSAYEAALGLCPMAIGIVISSTVCRPLLNKMGRKIVVIGLSLTLFGAFVLWITLFLKGATATALMMAPAIMIIGAGMGACFSSIYDVALGDLAQDEAGSASGSLSAIQQLASAIGSAVVVTLFFHLQSTVGDSRAMEYCVLIVAAIVVIGLCLVWLMPKSISLEEGVK